MADWNGFKKNGTTYIPNDATARAGVIANTKLIKDTVGWSGKNMFEVPSLSVLKQTNGAGTWNGNAYTLNGITFTVNNDKSIAVSGTASADARFFWYNTIVTDRKVTLSKVVKTSFSGYGNFGILNRSGGSVAKAHTLEFTSMTESTFTDNDTYTESAIYIQSGASANLVIYPMLRDANILDDTYEPYFGSTAFPRSEQAILGAKNLIPMPYADATKTLNGITYTVNSDGSVTVNGTASGGNSVFNITPHPDTRLQGLRGRFIVTTGGAVLPNGMAVNIRKSDDTNIWGINPGMDEIEIELTDSMYLNGWIYIYVANGTTVNNVKIYPMIRLATDTDPTYAPYAMTNRELTEKVQGIIDASTNAADFAAFKAAIGNL